MGEPHSFARDVDEWDQDSFMLFWIWSAVDVRRHHKKCTQEMLRQAPTLMALDDAFVSRCNAVTKLIDVPVRPKASKDQRKQVRELLEQLTDHAKSHGFRFPYIRPDIVRRSTAQDTTKGEDTINIAKVLSQRLGMSVSVLVRPEKRLTMSASINIEPQLGQIMKILRSVGMPGYQVAFVQTPVGGPILDWKTESRSRLRGGDPVSEVEGLPGTLGAFVGVVPDAKETAAAIAENLRGGLLKPLDDALLQGTDTASTTSSATSAAGAAVPGPQLPWMKHLPSNAQVVTWPDSKRIETKETRRGQLHTPPKLREKITAVPELLAVARGDQAR